MNAVSPPQAFVILLWSALESRSQQQWCSEKKNGAGKDPQTSCYLPPCLDFSFYSLWPDSSLKRPTGVTAMKVTLYQNTPGCGRWALGGDRSPVMNFCLVVPKGRFDPFCWLNIDQASSEAFRSSTHTHTVGHLCSESNHCGRWN